MDEGQGNHLELSAMRKTVYDRNRNATAFSFMWVLNLRVLSVHNSLLFSNLTTSRGPIQGPHFYTNNLLLILLKLCGKIVDNYGKEE